MNSMTDKKKTPDHDDLEAQDHPLTPDEKVDVGSEESMVASDPIAVTTPGDTGEPVASSGYPDSLRKEEEKRRKAGGG